MNSTDEKALEEAFHYATGLSRAEQVAYVARLKITQGALGQQLEALLSADAEDPEEIFAPVADAIRAFNEDSDNYWIKRHVGAFIIDKRIASGGMGAVFLAHRADREFDQKVAVKIMGVQLLATDAIARFRMERQLLADLNHPYIARLYDGGTTDNDLPYLAMEYVDGIPVDEYCQRHGLDIEERLTLFVRICEAVSYLHSNLIVHRDIKPSNILVDEQGNPRLLDFGIAKILQSDSNMTVEGALALSPDYASPEQITGAPISTAADVYSLGVLLYVLLCGAQPYAGETIADTFHAVLHREVVRPSSRIGEEGDSAQSLYLANTRHSSPARLRAQLRGDLDTIVLKALQKEPERRYRSVEQFSQDVKNYLERKPIQARPDSFWYSAHRFWQRHTVVLLLAGAVAVSIVGFSVFTQWQAAQIQQQKDIATREALLSSEVSRFLTGIFTLADPTESVGKRVTAREILDNASRRIEFELGEQPELKARLMHLMGKAYRSIGLASDADTLIEKSRTIKLSLFGEMHPSLVDSYSELGLIRVLQGDVEGQERLLRQALELSLTLDRPEPGLIPRQQTELAASLRMVGDLDQALALLLSARDQLEREPDTPAIQALRLRVQRELIPLYTDRGDFAAATALARQTLAETQRMFSSPHPEIARSLSDWGYVLHWFDDFEGALPLYRRALAMDELIYEEGNIEVIEDLYDLGALYQLQGDLDSASDYLLRAINLAQGSLAAEHPIIANSYNNLANVSEQQGDFNQSESHYLKALVINREIYGERHLEIATNLSNLALLYARYGKPVEAERLYREALEMRVSLLGSNHPHVGYSLSLLGGLLLEQDRLEEAEQFYLQALALREEVYGVDHPMAIAEKARFGQLLTAQERWLEAEQRLDEALDAIRLAGDQASPGKIALVLLARAQLHNARQEHQQAVILLDEARPLSEQAYPVGSTAMWQLHLAYAQALHGRGRTEAAKSYLIEQLQAGVALGRTKSTAFRDAQDYLYALSGDEADAPR